MARTLQFTGSMLWPLEDGGQAAKLNLSAALNYTSALAIEKVYASTVTDEVVALPMTSAKFLLLRAKTNDVEVKLNGAANAITLKADSGFLLVQNDDGAITGMTVTTTTAPATLEGYVFA